MNQPNFKPGILTYQCPFPSFATHWLRLRAHTSRVAIERKMPNMTEYMDILAKKWLGALSTKESPVSLTILCRLPKCLLRNVDLRMDTSALFGARSTPRVIERYLFLPRCGSNIVSQLYIGVSRMAYAQLCCSSSLHPNSLDPTIISVNAKDQALFIRKFCKNQPSNIVFVAKALYNRSNRREYFV